MKEYNCILSEKPDALDGTLEWIEEAIAKKYCINSIKSPAWQKLGGEFFTL